MSGPRYHRTRRQDQRLVGFECQGCGWVSFPEERRICKRCGDAPADYEEVQLAGRGEIKTFVVQHYLPDDIETPQPVAIVDVPQTDGEGAGGDGGDGGDGGGDDSGGEPARVYGLLTETDLEDLEVGREVEARFREVFDEGDRPINAIKFSIPRGEQ